MARPVRFAPPLVLMAVIYVLSAQPDLNSGLGPVDFALRKVVHMAEYGLLWFLWLRALDGDRPLLAAADEWHQTFVEGRRGTPIDVVIDAAGVLITARLLRARRPLRARP